MKKDNGYKEADEDIYLVQAAVGGDKAAFRKLFNRHTEIPHESLKD